ALAHTQHWQQLCEHAEQRAPLHHQLQQYAQAMHDTTQRMEQLQAQRMQLRTHYQALQEKVQDKQTLLLQEQRIQSLQAHRDALQPGHACPLCGSQEHPAIASYAALDVSITEQALQHALSQRDVVQRQGEAVSADWAAARAQQAEQHKQHEAIQEQLIQWQQRWEALAAGVTVADTSVPALQARYLQAQHSTQQLHTQLQAAELAEQQLQQAQAAVQQAQQQHHEARHALALNEQALHDHAQQSQQAQAAWQLLQSRTEQLAHTLSQQLQPLGYALPDAAAVTDWLQSREQEWTRWQQHQQQLVALERELHSLAQQSTQAAATAAHWQQQWAALEGAADAPPNSGAHVPADLPSCIQQLENCRQQQHGLQGQLLQAEMALNQLQQALQAAAAQWQQALHDSPFANEANFAAALLPATEHQRLQTLHEQLHGDLQRSQALWQAAQQRLAVLQAQALSDASAEDIQAQITHMQDLQEQQASELGACRARLADAAQLRAKQQSLLQAMEQQRLDCEMWQRLDGLIGSARGDKFRKFAQGLTLDHLLYLANQHLVRLHGRYSLRRKTTGELELDIVDSWQADVARDTRTLSGGESFLVSLALALALSDLVSHKASIDSLFLDEGFGTLDGETLEIALTALDALNASGKMIGIISHVEALKERIPVQIRVDKTGGVGHSKLSY
ncbi:MAG: SbcC/MukB-like Walker B domain-containing protein, partial [Comamonas sp.]